ncbi:hypothetical protein [Methylobacterium iners]|uniref:Uncharacterized protein n=1 Tax=Methylobacterium iners TaxID=418707 RepID=A0ABQ4RY45_9HYPH|nr:hypothetical protein [Methylobacterium iners]GJD95768.1 hypothetical protein OCOJLMKI_2982 [Methylobacterium iners]
MPAIRLDPSFLLAFKGLSKSRREWVAARLRLFQIDPSDKALRFRALRCAPGHFLIDSVRYDRIILRRETDDLYAVVDCGGHDIIDAWEARAGDER